MKIVNKPIDDLIPYEQNQKKHDEKQIKNVANSLKRFGWQQPIVIDKNDVVVIGHCRLLAARKLCMKEVPVTVADDLSEDEIRELRIVDNKTNESPWDLEQLQIDLDELQFDGFDFDFPQNLLDDVSQPINLDADEKNKPEIYVVRLKFHGFDNYASCEKEIKEMVEKWGCEMVVSDSD